MKEIITGIIFIIIGASFKIGSLTYMQGSVSNMGPGYYPGLVGVALAIVGLVIIIRELFWKS